MISVVIPLFNKSSSVLRCINSVLDQTFQQFEIIVIDDGSTDDSLFKIETNFSTPKLRLITQPNSGVSTARNKGVESSSFNWIAFLDADDFWERDYLDWMAKAIELHPESEFICSGGFIINADGTKILRLPKDYSNHVGYINFFLNPHVFLHTSATVVSKSLFFKAGGFPVGMKRNQDFAFFYSAAFFTTVCFVGYPISNYVGGISGQATSTPLDKVISHVIGRFNHVSMKSLAPTVNLKAKKDFKVFNRYELRHIILGRIWANDYYSIQLVLKNLNDSCLEGINQFERRLYISRRSKFPALMWLYFTKVIWRLRGYPVVGN